MARKARWGEAMAWAQTAARFTGDDCLLWPFGMTNGYGGLEVSERKKMPAHRYVCTLVYGDPPHARMDCAHSCGVRACCNPRHLRWATRAENEADKMSHGVDNRGERHGLSKLSVADVRAIRAAAGTATQRTLAQRFGVGQDQISRIVKRKRWAWLEGENA